MRKILCILLILLMAVMSVDSSFAAYAVNETDPDTGNRVVIEDGGQLLTASEILEVRETMKKVAQYCHAGVLTRAQTAGSGSRVEEIAYQWGKSVFGETDFIVFMIDMASRNICIYANNTMVRKFTRSDSDTVTDNVSPYASQEKFGSCTVEGLNQIAKVLEGEKIARPMKYISNVLIAACLSVILCFLIVSRTLKTRNAAEAVKITAMAAAGAGTAVLAQKLVRTVRHESSSGGGGFGGGRGGGGGGHSGGGGHHGF